MENSPHERIWQVYSTINEWIRFADTKAGVVLAAHGATLTVGMPELMKQKQYFYEHPLLATVVIVATVCAVVSGFFSIRCILPRLKIGEARSLIFFAHIAKAYDDPDNFAEDSRKHYQDSKGYESQVLNQIWANARVAWAKHKDSAYCLHALIIEMVLAVFGFLLAFCSK